MIPKIIQAGIIALYYFPEVEGTGLLLKTLPLGQRTQGIYTGSGLEFSLRSVNFYSFKMCYFSCEKRKATNSYYVEI